MPPSSRDNDENISLEARRLSAEPLLGGHEARAEADENDVPPEAGVGADRPPLEEVSVLGPPPLGGGGDDDGDDGAAASWDSSPLTGEQTPPPRSAGSTRSDRRRSGRRRRNGKDDGNRPTSGGRSRGSSFRDLLNRSSCIEEARSPGGSKGRGGCIDKTLPPPLEPAPPTNMALKLGNLQKHGSAHTIATIPSSISSSSTLSPFSAFSSRSDEGGACAGEGDIQSFSREDDHDAASAPKEDEGEERDDDGFAGGGNNDNDDDDDDEVPPRFSCRERTKRRASWLTRGAGAEADRTPAKKAGGRRKARASPPPLSSGKAPFLPAAAARARSDPLIVFGQDISSLSPAAQFGLCATGVFGFTIVYGYLQELLAVHIAGRRYALFLASVQFAGYAFWSAVLQSLGKGGRGQAPATGGVGGAICGLGRTDCDSAAAAKGALPSLWKGDGAGSSVPPRLYIGLSLIRSLDLGMTNGAMRYLNYPAKTLIKSSRVAFTMMLGIVIGGKKYRIRDYAAVAMLVFGLGVFLHADATGDAVFHPLGVAMLVVSLTCDGIVANWSEKIMREHSVSQDEFQAKLYSVAFLATTVAAHLNGELIPGIRDFLLRVGTIDELDGSDDADAIAASSWPPARKAAVLIMFASTGLFGSSCAGAITKRFGALSMSVTSTARKATTLFLSFAAFSDNRCTAEHVAGMTVFLTALLGKAACAKSAADRLGNAGAPAAAAARSVEDATVESASCSQDSECGEEDVRSYDDVEEGLIDVSVHNDDSDDETDEMNPLLEKPDAEGKVSLFQAARSSTRVGSVLRFVGMADRSRKLGSSSSHLS